MTGWQVIDAGVDYWSGTTEDVENGNRAYELARDIIENERLGSLDGAGTSIQGYFGVASEHAFGGQSEYGTFCRVSSDLARDEWMRFIGCGLRTTRLDLCVTATSGVDVPDLAYSIRYGPRIPTGRKGKPVGLEFFSKENGGDTTYVGSARSDQRGRIYDKSRESKGHYPLGAWRWEIQLRHELGDTIGRHLASRDQPEKWLRAWTRHWFTDRGIVAPWETEADPDAPRVARVGSSDITRMKWLKTSVAPLVQKLKARYTLNELRDALGLHYDVAEVTRTRITQPR